MSKRTVEEALQEGTKVKEFISRGIPGKNPKLKIAPESKPTEAEAAQKPKLKRRRPKNQSTPRSTLTPPDDLARTLAKATIQKTVRFHPNLIAQLDVLVRADEARGKRPRSFQQIQNEALQLWLNENS